MVDSHIGVYFGGVIACISCVVFLIGGLVYLRQRTCPLDEKETRSFLELSGSSILSGRKYSFGLLVFRICSFLYFLCVAWSWNWSVEGVVEGPNDAYQYFTNWNIVFITITFLLLSICNFAYLFVGETNPLRDNAFLELFCRNAIRIHDVAGTCALFITVVDFATLDPTDHMWNMIAHATNSIFMVFELAVNGLRPSMHSYLWNLSWLYFYLIFSWGLTGTGVKAIPYFFFATNSAAAFGWYLGLLLLHFIFFMIWFYIGNFKFYIVRLFGVQTVDNSSSNKELAVIVAGEELELAEKHQVSHV